ncbi:MAG: nuclear transport factor 2 family protein [Acidobacteriota bacterium]
MNKPLATQRIHRLYDAFNRRDVETVLEQMTDDVAWPRAFKGGYVQGPEAVRAYWHEQWQEIDARVEPRAIEMRDDGRFDVEVHQVVRDLAGNVLADTVVHHVYRFEDDRIARMDLEDDA